MNVMKCSDRCFPLSPAGGASLSPEDLRAASRFVGKEDTVPVRLLYSRSSLQQVPHHGLSTRVKASSGSPQVHCARQDGNRSVRMEEGSFLFSMQSAHLIGSFDSV